jgi:hypothetical protein
MCTTPHNTNNVDLSRDVLFQLAKPEHCARVVERMDRGCRPPLDRAIRLLAAAGDAAVMRDQRVRLEALQCWLMTQRSVAAWVAGVYGFMAAESRKDKARHRASVRDLVTREIENTKALMRLLDSDVEFMCVAEGGETPLMYGTNLKALLPKRIRLMERHRDDEPFIDHDYMEKRAGLPVF